MNLAADLKFPLAILKMEKFAMANEKFLQERFEEHNPKVSCLYPEVHDRLNKQTIPAPLCNSYTMGCPPVRGDNPRALASGLSYVQVDKHGITILYHLHQCRPCTSSDISC